MKRKLINYYVVKRREDVLLIENVKGSSISNVYAMTAVLFHIKRHRRLQATLYLNKVNNPIYLSERFY